MEGKKKFEMTSAMLHIMAMLFMLCDHLWATVVPGNDWLTCIGRLAFPIFAFMIVEGYFHTHSLRKYAGRLLLCALLSEIPFNLAVGSAVFYPLHQNVLWTFLIGIMLIHINEKAKKRDKLWLKIFTTAVTILLGFVLGLVSLCDYNYAGVFTVLVFYFFRGRRWYNLVAQIVLLWYINAEILSGFTYEFTLFGNQFFFVRQNLALLSLVPIWLYRGKQGVHNKALQFAYYAFYPVHLLILALIRLF